MEPGGGGGGGAGGGGGGGGGAATQGERRRGQPRAPSPARPREAPGSRQPNQKPSLPPKPSLRAAGSGDNSSRRAARATPGLLILSSKPRTTAAAAASAVVVGSRGGPGVGVQSGVSARGSAAPPRTPSHTESSNSDLSDCASEPLSGPEEEDDDDDDAGGNSSDDGGGGGGGMGPPRGGGHVRGPLSALPVGGRKVPVGTAGCVARGGAARGESPQGLVSVETMERQDLMREAEELRSENAYLKDEMEEMKAEMEEMRDSYLEEDVQALQELRRELDRTNKSVRILQYRLRKAERKGMKAAQGGHLDGELVRAMEQDLKVAKDVSVRLHRELESVEERRARLDEENDALRERLVELDTARQALANEVERTRENSLRRRSREPQKADKKSPAQEDSADLRCQLQFAKEEAVLMRRKLARVGKERDRSEGELQRYRALYGELDGQPALGEAGGPPSSRQAELKLRLKLLEEEANILGRKIVELEIENRGLKAELEDARAGVGCGGGGGLAGPPGERDGAAGASQDEMAATDAAPPAPQTATSDPDDRQQQQQQGRGTAPAAGEDRRPQGDPAVREELRAARQQLSELSGAVLRLQQENRLLATSLQRREEEEAAAAAAVAAAAAAAPGGQSRDATIAEMDGDEGRPPRRAREGPIGGESDATTAGGEKPPASTGGAGPGGCGDGEAAATATTAAAGGGGGGGDGEAAAGSEVTCCRLSPGAGLDVLAAYARVAGMRREAERLARTVDRVIGEAERLAAPGAVGVVAGAGPGPCREAQLLSAVMRDFRRELRTFATALGGAAGGGGDGAASSSMWRDDDQTPPSAINQHQEKQQQQRQQQQQQQENGVWDSWDQSETDSDATRRHSDSARRHSDTTWRDTDTTRRRTHSDNSGDGVAWAERRQQQRGPEGRGRDGGGDDDSGDDDNNNDEGEEEEEGGDHSSRELGARELLLQLKQLLGPRRGNVTNGQGPRAQVELSRGDGEGGEDRSDDSPGTEDSGVHSLSESSQAACHALVESLLAELRSRERRTATAHERSTSWETERRRLLSCLAQCECGCASLWPEVGDVVRRDLEEAEEQGSGLRRARSVSSMSEFRRLMESSPFLPAGGMAETPHDPLHGGPPSPSPPPSPPPPPPLSPDDVRFVREFSSPWGEGCPPRGWGGPPQEAGAPGAPRRGRGRGWRASEKEEEEDEVVGGEREEEEEGQERRVVWRGRRNEAPVGPRVDPAGATNLSDDMKRRVASRATARLSSSVATQVDGHGTDGANGTDVNPGGGPPARHSVSTQTSTSAWAPRRGPSTATPRGSAGSTPAASPSRGALHARPLSTASSASFSSSRADRPSSGTAGAAARGLAGASPRSLRRSPGGGGSSGRLDARPGTAGGGAAGVGGLSPWARSTTTRDSPVTRVAGDDRPGGLLGILGFSVATSPTPPPVPPVLPRAAALTLAVPTPAMAVAAAARERSPSPRPGVDGAVPVPPATCTVKAAAARGGGEQRAGARLSVGAQSTELRRSCDSLDAECGAEGNGDAARKGAESGEQERAAGGNEDHSEGCCSSLNPAVPCDTTPVATT